MGVSIHAPYENLRRYQCNLATGLCHNLTEWDVQIETLFCGICHPDLHQVRNEWRVIMPTVYPIVPGHEILGRVTKVGPAVTKHKLGNLAAVGCLVDSEGTCPQCETGLEQFCPNLTLTFPQRKTRQGAG